MTPDESNAALQAMQSCLQHYVWLQRHVAKDCLFQLVPKFHWAYHLAQMCKYQNPKTSFTHILFLHLPYYHSTRFTITIPYLKMVSLLAAEIKTAQAVARKHSEHRGLKQSLEKMQKLHSEVEKAMVDEKKEKALMALLTRAAKVVKSHKRIVDSI